MLNFTPMARSTLNQPKAQHKLNLGSCGRFEGWVNVDLYHDCDIKADIRKKLPFADNSFDVVLASHVLEHIPEADVTGAIAEIKRVAKPTAKIVLRGPNMETEHDEKGKALIGQGYDAPGFKHYWTCSESKLIALAGKAGLAMHRAQRTDLTGLPPATWAYAETILTNK